MATLADGRVVGSTRFLALRPEHRSVEIGWTWLDPSVWGTGVNVEAKLLMLRHAFEAWGCRRVELKTDAQNARSRGAMEAMGARFEGVHRKHMLVRDGREPRQRLVLDRRRRVARRRGQARRAPAGLTAAPPNVYTPERPVSARNWSQQRCSTTPLSSGREDAWAAR